MKKILLINGSPHEFGCTYTALREVSNVLEYNQIVAEILYLAKPIADCMCSTTGKSVFNDKVNEILDNLDEYAGIVVGSPVYYAGPGGQLCTFLDCLFYCSENRKEKDGQEVITSHPSFLVLCMATTLF